MKVYKNNIHEWVDSRWGVNGLWAWVMFLGWLAAFRGAYVVIFADNTPLLAKIFAVSVTVFIVLIGASSLFTVWPLTAYKVTITNDNVVTIHRYFFRKMTAKLNDVIDVREFKNTGLKSWLSPLHSELVNYKISIGNITFLLSSHMGSYDTLIHKLQTKN